LRSCERLVIRRRGRNEPPALIHDDGACPARANVNPEYVNKASSTASSQQSGDIIYGQDRMTREVGVNTEFASITRQAPAHQQVSRRHASFTL